MIATKPKAYLTPLIQLLLNYLDWFFYICFMKKLLYLFFTITLLGCSSNEEENIEDCIDINLIDENASCIGVYAPVCGCDGIVYSNSCKASSAGVTFYSDGVCY